MATKTVKPSGEKANKVKSPEASPAAVMGVVCEEASTMSQQAYIPCGAPAERMVKSTDGVLMPMCGMCANHNINNRGAKPAGNNKLRQTPGFYAKWGESNGALARGEVDAPPPVVQELTNPEISETIARRLGTFKADTNRAFEAMKLGHIALISAMMNAKENGGRASDYSTVYRAAYDANEALGNVLGDIGKIMGELKNFKLPEAFEAEGIKTLNMADGSRITITQSVRASVVGGKKDEAFEYLRANDLGDLITESLNASTLSAFVKTQLEKNISMPDDLFNVVVMPTTSLTRGKIK